MITSGSPLPVRRFTANKTTVSRMARLVMSSVRRSERLTSARTTLSARRNRDGRE